MVRAYMLTEAASSASEAVPSAATDSRTCNLIPGEGLEHSGLGGEIQGCCHGKVELLGRVGRDGATYQLSDARRCHKLLRQPDVREIHDAAEHKVGRQRLLAALLLAALLLAALLLAALFLANLDQ